MTRVKGIVSVMSTAVLAMSFCVAVASPAWAEPYPQTSATAANILTFENTGTGRCLDDSWDYNLRAYYCNNGDWQEWEQIIQGSGFWWVLRNVHTGRCADDSFSYGLRAYPCNYSWYQKWHYRPWRPELRNSRTDECMDDYGSVNLRSLTCNGSVWQEWTAS